MFCLCSYGVGTIDWNIVCERWGRQPLLTLDFISLMEALASLLTSLKSIRLFP